jgi:hypothetical protein
VAELPTKVSVPDGPPLTAVKLAVTPVGKPLVETVSVPDGAVTVSPNVAG